MIRSDFRKRFFDLMEFPDNPYHPLVWINGDPDIGAGTYIGGFTDINSKGAKIVIGEHCDISSFVAINVADTHRQALGIVNKPEYNDIKIGNNVYIGSHSVIMGGTEIGCRSVVGAGTILRGERVPKYSLVIGNPAVVKSGYYESELDSVGLLAE